VARVGVEKLLERLLGVKGLRVRGARFEPRGVVVEVQPPRRKSRCGVCGRPCPRYDSCPPRLWRHLALGRTAFWLSYAPRRVECREHGVRVEQVPWAAHDSHFTREFEEMVAWLAQRMDKSATCRLMAINWRTVGTIVERVVAERLDAQRLEELYVIGVDELSHRRHHQYLSVVVDHLKSRVVWMGEGKGEQTLNDFFDELGPERTRALTHVTQDLSAAFSKVVKQRAPQAVQVFDRFHVQKLANEALDEVRRQEVRDVSGTQSAAAVKKSRWALLKNPWNLTLRLAKGMDYRQPTRASEHLDSWSQWASRSKLKPFVRLAKTVRKHKQGIVAYTETGLSNGVVEGLNNKIRLVMRRAYGFRNTAALKAMVFLCCGGLVLNPPLPGIL
jgi:transposase